ncbi:M56 family metallopeptidase [Clostridium beijerinckii]|uniref:Beta-lactamase regulating signal transducer with metallopeptidase domain n=1 Tax=Clostridium beijerinckii TaxID=1520 RepID=A0AAE5LS93_CLOBE|nr:M56 family metallopeptidase [Clostridium beijerinckii]NSB16613.1 beta-lactamase regulating signal transducer with metallopeptidase domain [Clostridium beijerinckii]OOM26906.1 regulatory protein BlaR1 [Clostridium beijerinckii]
MNILNYILQMSLAGSFMFLILCIFKPLTKKTFSATWNYYMLFITLLIFIIPIGSFVKLPQIVEHKNYLLRQDDTNTVVQQNYEKMLKSNDKSDEIRVLQGDGTLKPVSQSQVNLKQTSMMQKIMNRNMLLYTWILGVLILAIKETYVYISFYKKLKSVSDIIDDKSIIDVFENCKKKLNIYRKIILKECGGIKSPMITEIITPTITIPKMDHGLDKLEIILDHELIHFKRKDLWVKVVALLANVINWFNPIVYIIRNRINIICELSLDEQLIKNMDKSKRKYYGEIILELIEYSQNKSLSLGASVCKSRKEIETRLKNIVFFKKSKKIIVCISLMVTMIFTSTSLLASKTVFASNNDTAKSAKGTEFAVFVADDGLYMSELKDNTPILLDKNEKIKLPKISKDGLYVAYTKEDDLYICNIETREVIEVAKNVESYDWNNSGNLICSAKNAGMSMYNTNTKKLVDIISNEYDYFNINCDSKNKVYANKQLETTTDKGKTIKSIGIISYDLDIKEEKVILEGKEGNNKEIGEQYTASELFESIGSRPNVERISSDDRYMYVWNKPNAGSMSADMTEFAVYDLLNNKFIENNNMIALAYKDNISQNPVDSSIVAVNNGEYRDMYSNKTLGILDIKANKFTTLIPENQVSMTPDYSSDGKNIVYSGADALKDDISQSSKNWESEPHYIYQVNIETKEITQITNNKSFDFMPKYLSENQILFVRKDGDSFSLWKTKDGVETKLADSLNFRSTSYTNTWYYGHYKTENVIDVYKK